jgi:hypothetical protein
LRPFVNRQPRGSHGSGLSITNPGKSQASASRRSRPVSMSTASTVSLAAFYVHGCRSQLRNFRTADAVRDWVDVPLGRLESL